MENENLDGNLRSYTKHNWPFICLSFSDSELALSLLHGTNLVAGSASLSPSFGNSINRRLSLPMSPLFYTAALSNQDITRHQFVNQSTSSPVLLSTHRYHPYLKWCRDSWNLYLLQKMTFKNEKALLSQWCWKSSFELYACEMSFLQYIYVL